MRELPRNDDGTLQAYAWPGGYAIYYIDGENSVLCPTCANESEKEEDIPAWHPIHADVHYEDTHLYCDQCSKQIEAAYAE